MLKAGEDGTPVTVGSVAQVREGAMLRIGVATIDGRGETVIGLVQMLAGENALQVATRARQAVEELQPSLPKGVRIVPYYDRALLVRRVIRTVETNLLEGAILVVAVLFAFLGNIRAGLIVASAIPLSMLLAFTGMVESRISANLMSLGAIDFGLIVDGAVVLVENIVRRLGEPEGRDKTVRQLTAEAAHEVVRPITFGIGIIIIVYLPILTLGGIEGKMFKPMAWTVVFALAGSLLLTLTLTPVLASLFLRKTGHEHEPRFVGRLRGLYLRGLDACFGRRALVLSTGLLAVVAGGLLATRLGGEFIPRLDEGDLSVFAIRPSSVGISEVAAGTGRIERVLKRFPEVITVVSRSGSPELATDVMGIELGDVFVMLKPRSEWTTARTKGELVEKMSAAVAESVPGIGTSFTQPIEMRFNELIAGVRSDVGVKLFGDDLDTLREKGEEIARVVAGVPGAADVKLEQTAGLPVIRVRVDRDRCARYGISVGDVLDTVEAARAGKVVGTVFEGQRRFSLAVRLEDEAARTLDALGNVPVASPSGASVPLGQLAEITLDTGPAQISREAVRRRIVVETNVRGRDVASFVAEARKRLAREVQLPSGYYIRWGGQFENLRAATRPPARRRAAGPRPHLRDAVLHLRLREARGPHLPERPLRGHGRCLRARPARASLLDLGGGGLHRPLRRGRAQRGRPHDADPRPRGEDRPAAARGAAARLRPADEAGADDGARRLARVRPDGARHGLGRRGPAAPGHGRHRRPRDLDAPDPLRPAHRLQLLPPPEGGRLTGGLPWNRVP